MEISHYSIIFVYLKNFTVAENEFVGISEMGRIDYIR